MSTQDPSHLPKEVWIHIFQRCDWLCLWNCHRVCHRFRRLAWGSVHRINASEQPHSELVTILRCHCRLLKNLTNLDLDELRDRRFPLPFSNLAQLPHLSVLSLPPLQKIELDTFVASRGFNLRKLRLVGSNDLTSPQIIGFLAMQPNLVSLDLSFCKKLDQSIIEEVSKLRHLKSLHLDGTQGITDLAPLASLPSLSKLTLHLSDVEDRAFEMMSTSHSLTSLDIQGTRTTEDVLRLLAPLSSLTRLHLSEGCISDQNAPLFKNLTNLTNLSFVKCQHLFGIGYENFGQLTKVERLELRNQPALSAEEWSFISNFKLLRQVSIIEMRDIGDEVLKLFADALYLSKLAISPNSVTFQGLFAVSLCPIRSLFLKNGSLLDDRAVPVLLESFPILAKLNIQQCLGLTAAGKAALEEGCRSRSIALLK